ncbi:MAG: polysaccharide biosynthesis tyrosine autokinase [Actinomycetia bacterium]|nr:polysaccharide biosynthesis tyrosine autokinase [Actinomycetes bacterium]
MQNPRQGEELDLLDYLGILRRRFIWFLTPLVLLSAASVWYTQRQPVTYRATASVLIDESAAQEAVETRLTGTKVRDRELANEINLADSDPARELVRSRLGLRPDAALPKGAILASIDADVLNFRFEGSTADEAALIATTWAEAYVSLKQEAAGRSIDRATERLRSQLDELRLERDEVRSDLNALEDRRATADTDEDRVSLQAKIDREASAISGELNLVDAQIKANVQSITQLRLNGDLTSGGTAWLFQTALPPAGALNASVWRNLSVGVAIGALLGVVLAMVRHQLDRSVNTVDDINRLGLVSLGAIPKSRGPKGESLAQVSLSDPMSPIADAYQKVRSALQFVALGNDARSILVTSPTEGNGKTTTAVNLALAFSGVDRKVVLVDADFRRPRIHTVFGTNLVPGVSDALVHDIPIASIAVASTAAARSSLAALPAGTEPPNPATFLASPLFTRFLAEVEAQSDMMVFDSPPVLPVADATSLCPHSDGVVMVVEAGHTSGEELLDAIDVIDRAGGIVLGVVLTKAKVSAKAYRYQYESSEDVGRSQRRHGPEVPSSSNGTSLRPMTTDPEGEATASAFER